MSILFHAKAIERAVYGELAPDADRRLRRHLVRCQRCRAHFEGLAAIAGPRAELARQRARLVAEATVTPPHRSRRVWFAALALPAAAVAAFVFVRPAAPPELTERGTARQQPTAPFSLFVYATRRDAGGGRDGLRLVAELPASGEATLSRADVVQLGYRNAGASVHVTLLALGQDASGARWLRLLTPQGRRSAKLEPTARTVPLGSEWDLGTLASPARVELHAVTAARPFVIDSMREASDLEYVTSRKRSDDGVAVDLWRLGTWQVAP